MAKATEMIEPQNLRRLRAEALTAAVMAELRYVLDRAQYDPSALDKIDRDVSDGLFETFYRNGASIMTDEDRRKAGLEPRDELGWTPSELVEMERHRFDAMAIMAYPMMVKQP